MHTPVGYPTTVVVILRFGLELGRQKLAYGLGFKLRV